MSYLFNIALLYEPLKLILFFWVSIIISQIPPNIPFIPFLIIFIIIGFWLLTCIRRWKTWRWKAFFTDYVRAVLPASFTCKHRSRTDFVIMGFNCNGGSDQIWTGTTWLTVKYSTKLYYRTIYDLFCLLKFNCNKLRMYQLKADLQLQYWLF